MLPSEQNREKSILGAINGGLILLDDKERVTCWNTWMESATGLAEADVTGKTLAEIFPGADLRRLPSAITAALTSSASTLITNALSPHLLPLHNRSNRPLLHDITVSPVGDQPVTACMIFVIDVTMATNRERYLRQQQNARYDAVVESAPDVIITVDQEGPRCSKQKMNSSRPGKAPSRVRCRLVRGNSLPTARMARTPISRHPPHNGRREHGFSSPSSCGTSTSAARPPPH
jgi:PAS domain S-box-containing protein